MRLETLRIKGLTRYESADIDFSALGPGLLAIAGPNGAGKTSVLESAFAALHLELPSYPGNIADSCHGKDAVLDLHFSNGAPYRALIAVDAVAKKTEAYLYDGQNNPLTSGKIREYSAEIEKRFGSPRLFLSACLSAQKKAGAFLTLSKSERKDLLAEILDTGGLQALAEAAREQSKATEAKLLKVRAQVEAYEKELVAIPTEDTATLDAMRIALTSQLETCTKDHADAREDYGRIKAQLSQAETALKEHAARIKDRDELINRIRDIKIKKSGLCQEQARLKERISAARQKAQEEANRLPEYQKAEEDLSAAQTAKNGAALALESAERELLSLREKHSAAKDAASNLRVARENLARAVQGAALLSEVPCKGEGEFSGCGFLKRANEDKEKITALEVAEKNLAPLAAPLDTIAVDMEFQVATTIEKRQALKDTTTEVDALSALAAKAPLARAASKRIEELDQEAAEGEVSFQKREQEIGVEETQVQSTLARVEEGIRNAPPGADNLKEQLMECELNGLKLKGLIEHYTESLRAADQRAAAAKANEERKNTITVELGMLRATVEDHARDAGEWAILERALGRDGIQALEIDAAGPELSGLTNDLLTACFGPRFEVRFVTQVPKADGKGTKEVFDVAVIDHERGREASAERYSGGEGTIVSEAISLALALYVGKHSGRRFETIFRDETAGQLDPENASAYVTMLRKAREIGGLHQVIFIAQQPAVWEQADVVLWTEGGTISVREGAS